MKAWLYTVPLYSPSNGIAQLVGEYRNNKLSGVGKLVKEDGVVVEGYFRQAIVDLKGQSHEISFIIFFY